MEQRRGERRIKRLPWLTAPLVWALLAAVVAVFGPPALFSDTPGGFGGSLAEGRGTPPNKLLIPDIKLDARVIPIALDSRGVLTPPSDTRIVGWWDKSAGAGTTRGQILLTGHTVHTGGGVMNRMGDVQKGDDVVLVAKGKRYTYSVTENIVLTKAQLAKRAYDLFGQNRHHGRLVLVTCTDFRDGAYQSNIVVFADPVR